MHKLLDYVCDELKSLEKKVGNGQQLSSAELQYADTLAHLKKNLLKGEEMMGEEDGYSNRSYDRVYDDRAYHDGRYFNARRRDSMGRYSRRGYSMADDEILSDLHEIVHKAPDERTKKKIQKLIDEMETM